VKLKLPFQLEDMKIPASLEPAMAFLRKGAGKVSVFGAAAGATIDIISATRDERAFLSAIASEYRPEIAERLGLAEDQVTEQHYNMAFDENPILQQAKQAAQMDGKIRAANTTIAAGVGLLAGLVTSSLSHPKKKPGVYTVKDSPANIVGGVVSTFGGMMAGKAARHVMHTRRLDGAIEKTAHYQIMQIKEKQQRGEETTPADIFLVQLMLNPLVNEAITQSTGKRFCDMEPEQKMQILQTEFPEFLEVNMIMADRINNDGMRPQQLMFGEVRTATREHPKGTNPDMKAATVLAVEPQAVEASNANQAVQEVMEGQIEKPIAEKTASQPMQSEAVEVVDLAPPPASHVQRYTPNAGQEQGSGFANRIANEPSVGTLQR
jgi:hypothetical protein